MLYPEAKERENRFKLALRMGLPVFALAVITITSVLLRYFSHIPDVFITVAFALLGIMIYYLFYLIYAGFSERVTDPITHLFTREYFFSHMLKELKKSDYTFMLFSVVNIEDINRQYGIANGDKILYDAATKIADYFDEHKLTRIPIAHFKGGDILVALEGKQDRYRSLMELVCLRFRQYNFGDIEIEIVGSMTDSTRVGTLEKLIEHLFELQSENLKSLQDDEDEIDPGTIEGLVSEAIEQHAFSFRYQAAYKDNAVLLYEMAVKLHGPDGKMIHQKRFMPVLTRMGLLRQFDQHQVEAAIAMLPRLKDGEKIAVNVAPSSVRNPHFYEYVMMMLSNNDVVKGRLVFIIGESSYYHESIHFNARLQGYRRAGVLMGLDRLGGQHTTLRYLNDLDVDYVRLEFFYGKQLSEPKIASVVSGFGQMIRQLGCQSWIRMIETEAAFEDARAMGIDILQGNYLSPIDSIKE